MPVGWGGMGQQAPGGGLRSNGRWKIAWVVGRYKCEKKKKVGEEEFELSKSYFTCVRNRQYF
jgi:hypothetical protein